MTTLTNIYQNKRKSFTNVHLFPKFETRNKAIQESIQPENPTYGRLAYRTNFFRLRPERRVLSLFRLDKRTHEKTGNRCFINHRGGFQRCKSFCSDTKAILSFYKENDHIQSRLANRRHCRESRLNCTPGDAYPPYWEDLNIHIIETKKPLETICLYYIYNLK